MWFAFAFSDWTQIRDFLGEELPKFFEGWISNGGTIGYGGNRLLNATDPVIELKSTLCGGYERNGKDVRELRFDVALGFSKRRWNVLLKRKRSEAAERS